jgi:hypothetical protein
MTKLCLCLLAAAAQDAPPPAFEPGAGRHLKGDVTAPAATRERLQAYEAWVRSGKLEAFAGKEEHWLPCIILGLLSDQEDLARASFRLLHDGCARWRLTTESGGNPVRLDLVNAAPARAEAYAFWCEWWSRPANRKAVGAGLPPEGPAVASLPDDLLPLLLCPMSAADLRADLDRLASERPGERAEALGRLHGAVLEHEEALRDAYAAAKDPETMIALRNVLELADSKRRLVVERARDASWLLGCLGRIRDEAPADVEFGIRARRFLATLERCRDALHGVAERRRRIERQCALGDAGSARWAEAHQAWRDFQAEPGLPEEARKAVDGEIAAMNVRSLRSLDDVRRRAVRELESGRRLEAVRILQEARPRFDGTDGGIQLERILDLLRP